LAYNNEEVFKENKRRKLFVIKQSTRCNFIPKMHQNVFGGCLTDYGAQAGPTWEATALPSRTEGPT